MKALSILLVMVSVALGQPNIELTYDGPTRQIGGGWSETDLYIVYGPESNSSWLEIEYQAYIDLDFRYNPIPQSQWPTIGLGVDDDIFSGHVIQPVMLSPNIVTPDVSVIPQVSDFMNAGRVLVLPNMGADVGWRIATHPVPPNLSRPRLPYMLQVHLVALIRQCSYRPYEGRWFYTYTNEFYL